MEDELKKVLEAANALLDSIKQSHYREMKALGELSGMLDDLQPKEPCNRCKEFFYHNQLEGDPLQCEDCIQDEWHEKEAKRIAENNEGGPYSGNVVSFKY